MRIAVTGRHGQLVSALVAAADGVEVVAIGRPELDLATPESVGPALAAARPDAIIHAAAYTAVDRAEDEGDLALRINADGAAAVGRAAAALDVPMIHISTDYVFGNPIGRPHAEDDRTGPVNLYGRTKLIGEHALRNLPGRAPILIARLAWLHSDVGTNFVRTMLRLAVERPVVRVVADQQGSPTCAHHAAPVLIALAQRMRAWPVGARETLHVAGPDHASWAEVAECVFDEAERQGRTPVRVARITTADYPTRARRAADTRLDAGRLRAVHGLALPPWRSGVAETVRRLLTNARDVP